MCGRTACTLNPNAISRSCRYKQKDGKSNDPKWILNKDKYNPGHNKAPQSFCPVLLSNNHFKNGRDKLEIDDTCFEEGERVLCAMKWGLVPSWSPGCEYLGGGKDKLSYNMNNARSDTMLEKRSYKIPLRKGQRCVVVADGFYEWNKTENGKQPYYIYFPKTECETENQKRIQEVENSKSKDDIQEINIEGYENNTCGNCNMLMMAGIFEKSFHDGEDLYSYTIITVDSHDSFSWLHHRMPAMLENDAMVQLWLDFENVPLEKALEVIKPKDCLDWHPVSKYVNNSRNNGYECTLKVDLEALKQAAKPKRVPESKSMLKWLKSGGTPNKQENCTKLPCTKKRKHVYTIDKWVKRGKK